MSRIRQVKKTILDGKLRDYENQTVVCRVRFR